MKGERVGMGKRSFVWRDVTTALISMMIFSLDGRRWFGRLCFNVVFAMILDGYTLCSERVGVC